ncbi:MAG: hypothetical protein SFU56_15465 [Capsulimonadales bacterium]|nr:hypothetical protein [Capsulimonadales bacterium]
MTKRDKQLVTAAGVLFGLTFALVLYRYLESKRPVPVFDPMIMTPEREARLVNRCRWMKDKLRPWAERNADLLRTMLRAAPEDMASLDAVWKEIPALSVARNGNDNDLVLEKIDLPMKEFDKPIKFFFLLVWDREMARTDDSAVRGDPNYQADMARIYELLGRRKAFYWNRFRDLPWIETMEIGPYEYTLWASGRITRRTYPKDFSERSSKAKFRFKIDEEVMDFKEMEGPYDFLR